MWSAVSLSTKRELATPRKQLVRNKDLKLETAKENWGQQNSFYTAYVTAFSHKSIGIRFEWINPSQKMRSYAEIITQSYTGKSYIEKSYTEKSYTEKSYTEKS